MSKFLAAVQPAVVTTEVRFTEADMMARLTREALEVLGMLDGDGNPVAGVATECTRYGERQFEGYNVRVQRWKSRKTGTGLDEGKRDG